MTSYRDKLLFFPTPYEDEIMYSVFCRYFKRSGQRNYRKINRELNGKDYGSNFRLPSNLSRLVEKLPVKADFTEDFFIENHSLFPYIKPFMLKKAAEEIYVSMKEIPDARRMNLISGIVSNNNSPFPKHLRYCPKCWKADMEEYGEMYWHRKEQLPGVEVCALHGCMICDSKITVAMAGNYYYPASMQMLVEDGEAVSEQETVKRKLSQDSHWLLKNGMGIGTMETTHKRYLECLSETGYCSLRGFVMQKRLLESVNDYYGSDYLKELRVYNEKSVHSWLVQISRNRLNSTVPLKYLLVIQFLCGNVEAFFERKWTVPQPYGIGPWPCHNKLCKYYLKDIIETIDIEWDRVIYRGKFQCPVCGFTYRRKGSKPKEEQYQGQISIESYGWFWEKKLEELLKDESLSTWDVAKMLHCDYYTVIKSGIRLGILSEGVLPENRKPKQRKKMEVTKELLDQETLRNKYRSKWTELQRNYPKASRSELRLREHRTYEWLRINDKEWYEDNIPERRIGRYDWMQVDKVLLEKAKEVVETMSNPNERPVRFGYYHMQVLMGTNHLKEKIKEGKLPKTAAFLLGYIETEDEWRKRKIEWAAEKLSREKEYISVDAIRTLSSISKKYFDEEIANECIEKLNRK